MGEKLDPPRCNIPSTHSQDPGAVWIFSSVIIIGILASLPPLAGTQSNSPKATLGLLKPLGMETARKGSEYCHSGALDLEVYSGQGRWILKKAWPRVWTDVDTHINPL